MLARLFVLTVLSFVPLSSLNASAPPMVNILQFPGSAREAALGTTSIVLSDGRFCSDNPASLGFLSFAHLELAIQVKKTWNLNHQSLSLKLDNALGWQSSRFSAGVAYRHGSHSGAGLSYFNPTGRPDTNQNDDGLIRGGSEFDLTPYHVRGDDLHVLSFGLSYSGLIKVGVGGSAKKYSLPNATLKPSSHAAYDLGMLLVAPILKADENNRAGTGRRTTLEFNLALTLNNLGPHPTRDNFLLPRMRRLGLGLRLAIGDQRLEWMRFSAGYVRSQFMTGLEAASPPPFENDLLSREPLTDPQAGDYDINHFGLEIGLGELVSLRIGHFNSSLLPSSNTYPGLGAATTNPARNAISWNRTARGLAVSTVGLRKLLSLPPGLRSESRKSFFVFLRDNLNVEFSFTRGYLPVQNWWLEADLYSLRVTL